MRSKHVMGGALHLTFWHFEAFLALKARVFGKLNLQLFLQPGNLTLGFYHASTELVQVSQEV